MTSALSTSPLAADLLAGPLRHGLTLRHGYIHFGDTMLVVTEPGAWRMPNGIESEFVVPPGERATIGNGALRIGRATLAACRLWNPRPRRLFMPCLAAPAGLPLARLAGLGPGLTPLGDDILLGYVAGGVL
jgi:hypothetical protein